MEQERRGGINPPVLDFAVNCALLGNLPHFLAGSWSKSG